METKYGEYKIISECGSGGCGKVFAVELKENKENKAFILKTLREDKIDSTKVKDLQNEIDILIELNKKSTSENIPKLYAYDKTNYQDKENKKSEDNNNIIINEEILKEKNKVRERPYYVTDLFSKGNLLYYIYYGNFTENHAKVIFKKILDAITFCHEIGICHLDIKPANIMLDKDYKLIIIDFGYAAKFIDENNNKIYFSKYKGTKKYVSPEMRVGKEYDGEKCDIFSLGQVLFNLVTRKSGFITSKPTDRFYCLIKDKNYEEYWKKVFDENIKKDLSENFKNLYLKMVAFNPDERATIKDILESPWLQEYNNLSQENKENLENEVIAEFEKIYDKLKDINSEIKLADKIISAGYDTRGIDDEYRIFSSNIIPKKIANDRLIINHHIIINGYLEVSKFMNSLVKEINRKFEDEISIIASEEDLKFKITFENEEEEDEDNDDNDDNEKDANITMIVELYKYEDGRYLLEFLRTEGELQDYYEKFLKIKEIIKKLL